MEIASFRLLRHEVTYEQYDAFALETGRPLPSNGGMDCDGPEGNVNVAYAMALEIRVFSAEGTYVRTIGGRGEDRGGKGLPVLQCGSYPLYVLEDEVLRRVDEILVRVDREAVLEVIRFAA